MKITAAEANRRFYREYARRYDEVEVCASASADRALLTRAIEQALQYVVSPRRVLDAGGGTGNAASILLEKGLNPVVVDVSAEMLDQWTAKAERQGVEAKTVVSTVEHFLEQDSDQWDLIVFSSVLHHLGDPSGVVRAASRQLAAGGAILTIFDPTPANRLGRFFRRVDWVSYALIHARPMLYSSLKAKFRWGDVRRTGEHIGRLAERYALDGLDDKHLTDAMRASKLEIVAHDRLYYARQAVVRFALRLTRQPSMFLIIAHRPEARM